jgi:predicted nucleic acid-binding protein
VTLRQAVELSARLGVYAYDAYIIACALNHRAPIVTLDAGLAARARELKLEVPEVRFP